MGSIFLTLATQEVCFCTRSNVFSQLFTQISKHSALHGKYCSILKLSSPKFQTAKQRKMSQIYKYFYLFTCPYIKTFLKVLLSFTSVHEKTFLTQACFSLNNIT